MNNTISAGWIAQLGRAKTKQRRKHKMDLSIREKNPETDIRMYICIYMTAVEFWHTYTTYIYFT